MNCKNCGEEISGNAKFCKNCGETVKLTQNSIFKDKKKIGIIAVAIIVLLSGLYYYLDNGRRIENIMNEISIIDSRFDEYILSGEDKESYDLISKDIENLSDNKELGVVKDIYSNIKSLEENVISGNTLLLGETMQKASKRDFSRAYEDEIIKLNEYKTEAENLIKEKKFASTEAVLSEWNKLLDDINIEYDNYEVLVNQMDFSEYPKIKAYIEISDKVTGEVPNNIDPRFFYISERRLNDIDFLKKTVMRASQLDQVEKLNINMVADISGSMYGYPLEYAKSMMSSFLNRVQFSIGDMVELTGFSDGVYTLKPFTNNAQELQMEIGNLYTGSSTALYDALFASVNTTAVQSGAKCVIAFTDGMDNFSSCTPDDVINASQRYNVPVFIVGVGDYLDNADLRRIAESTGGSYYNVYDFEDIGSLYDDIYRQQKQLYLVEYETGIPINEVSDRMIEINVQTREYGGKTEHQFKPAILGGTGSQLNYEDEIDKLIAGYLTNYVHAINNHDYSYIEDYIIAGSSIESQVKPYIMKDIKEKLLSFEILEKNFKDDNTCIVNVRETYEIQNYKEPLHMRALEGKLQVKKDANGKWKLDDFAAKYKIISKINY